MSLWDDLADERRALADLLESLTPDQWQVQTLCPAWTVHDMAAHLVVPTEFSKVEMITTMLRARGDTDRLAVLMAARRAQLSSSELVARLRANATSHKAPPIIGVLGPYVDALVHGEDIRTPLGLVDTRPAERWRAALDFLVSSKAKIGFRTRALPDLWFQATDVEWQYGVGDVVSGPAAALGLALMSRDTGRLDELDGPGADRLRAWARSATA